MRHQATQIGRKGHEKAGLSVLTLTALGIVFGDLGTSPLYTLKTVLELAGGAPSPETALGLLSLLIWTLFVITSLKYVLVAMNIDNQGEGGILALMSLLGVQTKKRHWVVALGLFGAALIYGDGAITPAISVLSALEGLKIPLPSIADYVVPASVAVLLLLFTIQPRGTAAIGQLFGPVMTLWFLAIGALGLYGVFQHPAVLWALNPVHGLRFLFESGPAGFIVLGGVFLCVTGAEALYADMGHVGARSIRLAWYFLVLPSLVLNYAGQTALVMTGQPIDGNIFYRLCPEPLLLPMIGLATLATVIASQSIVTGAFSMTRQAIQLGWMPRLYIKQTSSEGYGQIYVGAVNWLLMIVTIALTIAFGSSDRLAGAYGIAVAMTMSLTTILLFTAMIEIWRWPVVAACLVAGAFFIIDLSFLSSNMLKLAEGGYVPLTIAVLVFGVMNIWHRGVLAVGKKLAHHTEPWDRFIKRIARDGIPRVPGTAIFLSRTVDHASPILLWHVKHNRALHEHVMVLNVRIEPVPFVDPAPTIEFDKLGDGMWRGRARFGFMDTPDVPDILAQAHALGCRFDLDDLTYYIGHETVVHREDGKGLPAWQEALFAAMERNSIHVTDFFRLPNNQVVEIGRQIAI